MAESTVQPGKSAASGDDCGWFSCRDENDCCTHCGAHIADPCDPTCKHYDGGPADECDARPDEEEPPVMVVVTSWSGGSVRMLGTREALEEYAAARIPERYREQVVAKMLRWLADGAKSPYAVPAWHGETEFWSVDATA
ncbi:hypothetical protein ONA70_00330 [Micromonospora yasonensis]|uniref:hypothetical protein n=1 Tax=Micromonospora TaxID=1873 RepID=UPI00082854F2|nr:MULTISPECIES: hypothetical protein [Micromonospora]MCW3838548.1 hypothetical protein [Micromonospora yasonensis]SCL43384.1 hypothetical protein GA0070615_6431 [Micromonospora aurantiaca]